MYNVNNIIQLNLILAPSGLGFADFSSAFIFARATDGSIDEYFVANTYRDYASLSEVAVDFATDSEVYLMASRWFANLPTPFSVSVYMWDDSADSASDVASQANNEAWRYWYFFDYATYANEIDGEDNAIALAAFGDAGNHGVVFTISDAAAINPALSTDLASVLKALGNRHVFVGYKDPASVALDSSQSYSMIQLAAAFHKFRPEGLRTAITGEYQVLPGVVGDNLTTTAYNALKAKNAIFFTQIELQGSIDNSRVINSKSMSSYGEFMDDVVNLDVLQNRLQVNGYNYIAGTGSKRPLTPQGYAGLLDALDKTCKAFYDNGVLGPRNYVDPLTGETKLAKFGYVIFGNPEDVYTLSDAQIAARQFPETTILAILARAGHTASITVNVE
jgi:hypothetical protein